MKYLPYCPRPILAIAAYHSRVIMRSHAPSDTDMLSLWPRVTSAFNDMLLQPERFCSLPTSKSGYRMSRMCLTSTRHTLYLYLHLSGETLSWNQANYTVSMLGIRAILQLSHPTLMHAAACGMAARHAEVLVVKRAPRCKSLCP